MIVKRVVEALFPSLVVLTCAELGAAVEEGEALIARIRALDAVVEAARDTLEQASAMTAQTAMVVEDLKKAQGAIAQQHAAFSGVIAQVDRRFGTAYLDLFRGSMPDIGPLMRPDGTPLQ